MTDLIVGISRSANIKNRNLKKAEPAPGEPRLWLESAEDFAKVFSSENIKLFRLIASKKPKGYVELERLTGMPRNGIGKRLRKLTRYGLIDLLTTDDGDFVPVPRCDRVIVQFQVLPNNMLATLEDAE